MESGWVAGRGALRQWLWCRWMESGKSPPTVRVRVHVLPQAQTQTQARIQVQIQTQVHVRAVHVHAKDRLLVQLQVHEGEMCYVVSWVAGTTAETMVKEN